MRPIYQTLAFNFDDDKTIYSNTVILTRKCDQSYFADARRLSTGIIEFRANLLDRGRNLLHAPAFIITFVSGITHAGGFDSIRPFRTPSLRRNSLRSLSCRSFRPRGLPLFSSFRRKRILAYQAIRIKVTQQQSSLNCMKFRGNLLK